MNNGLSKRSVYFYDVPRDPTYSEFLWPEDEVLCKICERRAFLSDCEWFRSPMGLSHRSCYRLMKDERITI